MKIPRASLPLICTTMAVIAHIAGLFYFNTAWETSTPKKPYIEDFTLAIYSEKHTPTIQVPRSTPHEEKKPIPVKQETLPPPVVQRSVEKPKPPEKPTLKPTYLETTAPIYPEVARRNGQEGLVYLLVAVDEEGIPTSITVKTSSGYPLLDAAAVKAVKRWKFKPAYQGAYPVDSEVEIPIRFRLQDAAPLN
jgi:TonB family protein